MKSFYLHFPTSCEGLQNVRSCGAATQFERMNGMRPFALRERHRE